MSEEDKLKMGTTTAMINGKNLKKDSVKREYLKKLAFYQLQLCREVSVLEPFILPSMEHVMDSEQTLLSYLLQQQNHTLTSDNPLLFDFKAPLQFEILLLNDAQM